MDNWAIVAGCFAVVSIAVSFYEIIKHLSNFTKPYLQRYIIRILLMVPIYSLNAWIAMVVPRTGLYLDSLREVYESYVIYSFMKYLLNFLNYDTNLQQYIQYKPGPNHIFPFCCLPQCIGGKRFLIKCKHGILQYVVVRPMTTLIAFTSQLLGFYGEGNYNPLSGYVYPVLLIVNNASQVLAMYSLVIFYTGFQAELGPMKPLAKFFSIKLVVFFSFFQSVLISGLLEIEMIAQTMHQVFPDLQDKVSIGRKMQELLICFDMLLASIGHLFAFPYKPYTEPNYRRSARLATSGDHTFDSSPPPTQLASHLHEGHQRRHRQYKYSDDATTDGDNHYSGQYNHDRSCCSALCSIFDFSEDKSDIGEHFSEIFAKLRQLFSRAPLLPTIVHNRTDELEGASANIGGNYNEDNDTDIDTDWPITTQVVSNSSSSTNNQQHQQNDEQSLFKTGLELAESTATTTTTMRTDWEAGSANNEPIADSSGHPVVVAPVHNQTLNASSIKNYQSINE